MNRTEPGGVESRTRRKSPIERLTSRSKKKNKKLLELLRAAMVAVTGLIVLLLMVLLILPFFRVGAICVEGANEVEAKLIEAELQPLIGEEIFSIDGTLLSNEYIYAQKNVTKFGYIKRFKLHRGLNSITIEILERNQLAYGSLNDLYYLFNEELTVLASTQNEADFAAFPKAEMPAVSGFSVGLKLMLEDGDRDFAYIGELMHFLGEQGLSDRVTSLNFAQKYSVSYVLDGSCEFLIGSVDQLPLKLELADEIIARQGENLAERFLIDVSNTASPTYRPIG